MDHSTHEDQLCKQSPSGPLSASKNGWQTVTDAGQCFCEYSQRPHVARRQEASLHVPATASVFTR